MVSGNDRCTVAILRPPETSWLAFGEAIPMEEGGGGRTDAYCPYTDDWVDGFREKIEDVAEEFGIRPRLQEYQLHRHRGTDLPGRKRRRMIQKEANVITTIDPSWDVAAFVHETVRRQPDMRAIFAYSSRQELEASYDRLATARTPVFVMENVRRGMLLLLEKRVEVRYLPRMFGVFSRNERQMKNAFANAFLFPDGDAHAPFSALPDAHGAA